jgi:hypothetical protein
MKMMMMMKEEYWKKERLNLCNKVKDCKFSRIVISLGGQVNLTSG